MYIRRKVFSTYIDEETGEEKLFSVNEIISEDEYVEKLYAETAKGEKKKKVKLSEVNSHRGLGRSLFIGGLPGAISAHAGKKAANKADEEGKSDKEIIREASKAGRRRGMKLGALEAGVATLGTAGLGAGIGAGYAHLKNESIKIDPSEINNRLDKINKFRRTYNKPIIPGMKDKLIDRAKNQAMLQNYKKYMKKGAKIGAGLGATAGLLRGASIYAAGHYGAKKNARKRLEKRNALENEINSK